MLKQAFKRFFLFVISAFITTSFSIHALSISEKKALINKSENDLEEDLENFLTQLNQNIICLQKKIQENSQKILEYYEQHGCSKIDESLLSEITTDRKTLIKLETQWQELISKSNFKEEYGLWHSPEITLGQLVIDYGSCDYVYLIPPDISAIKLTIASNLPIPRAAWNNMLEVILHQNGVGVKTLNPYLKQLFFIQDQTSPFNIITNRREDLDFLPPDTKVSFLLSPELSEVDSTHTLLSKCGNFQTTQIQRIGKDILVLGQVGEIQSLLKFYDFIAKNRGEKEYRIIPIRKIEASEAAKILNLMFDKEGEGEDKREGEITRLKIVPLQNSGQSIFLIGSKEEVRKAEEVISNLEDQVKGAREKTIFWYKVRHSNPIELADVLYRVYNLMTDVDEGSDALNNSIIPSEEPEAPSPPPPPPGQDGFYPDTGGYIVNPPPAAPKTIPNVNANKGRNNFIVDPKTNSIIMVVEISALEKIKKLIEELDVEKQMVQIDTLLFEKFLSRENTFGLNLLNIGKMACAKNIVGALFQHVTPCFEDFIPSNSGSGGAFEFFLSRKKTSSGIPAFDLAYRFLQSQDDIQINENPSILTVNQTPGTIAVKKDISLHTGALVGNNSSGPARDIFVRAQYGITISIKPTIHLNQDERSGEKYDYISLNTNITFDRIDGGANPLQPIVTRRHIVNEVQVADGETVILGGLRSKISGDVQKKPIPFLCDLPGVGKLFSYNSLKDQTTEMFVFITPRIIKNSKDQLVCLRQKLLSLRPGDLPYFLACVEEAFQYEKAKLAQGSLQFLFGQEEQMYYFPNAEDTFYDGS